MRNTMLLTVFIFHSLFVFTNALINTKCFQWIYNDGQDCSTWLPSLNLIPLPEITSDKNTCPEATYTNAPGTPWECYIFNPACLDSIKPEFLLYTPNHKSVQSIDYTDLKNSVQDALVDSTKSLYIIVHSFGSTWPRPWMFDMKDALLKLDRNVLLVKWTYGSGSILDGNLYIQAAANTQAVGKGLANVVQEMINQKKADLKLTTIVGHSLGAHIAGYAGNGLPGLNRIIGLDPAGPMFACAHADARLDETDAQFVEVIHTNGDTFTMGGAGTLQQMGTVDFYPNGGWLQPGCSRGVPKVVFDLLHPTILLDVLQLDFSMLGNDISCNHIRVLYLFLESIQNSATPDTSCMFTSFPCSNEDNWDNGQCFKCQNDICPNAGLPVTNNELSSKGKFFFNTFSSSSYCGSEFLITLTSNDNAKGSISMQLFNDNGDSQTISIQGDADTLTANTQKRIVALAKWEIQKIVRAIITYKAYDGGLLGFLTSGNSQWTLTSSSITDSKGRIVKTSPNLRVSTGVDLSLVYQ